MTVPLFANIHLCGSILTEVFFVLTVSQILYGSMPDFTTMLVFIILLGFFAIGAPRRTGRYGARLIGLDHRYSRFRRGRNGIIAYDIRFARQLRYGLQRDGRWCPYPNY